MVRFLHAYFAKTHYRPGVVKSSRSECERKNVRVFITIAEAYFFIHLRSLHGVGNSKSNRFRKRWEPKSVSDCLDYSHNTFAMFMHKEDDVESIKIDLNHMHLV